MPRPAGGVHRSPTRQPALPARTQEHRPATARRPRGTDQRCGRDRTRPTRTALGVRPGLCPASRPRPGPAVDPGRTAQQPARAGAIPTREARDRSAPGSGRPTHNETALRGPPRMHDTAWPGAVDRDSRRSHVVGDSRETRDSARQPRMLQPYSLGLVSGFRSDLRVSIGSGGPLGSRASAAPVVRVALLRCLLVRAGDPSAHEPDQDEAEEDDYQVRGARDGSQGVGGRVRRDGVDATGHQEQRRVGGGVQ